MTGIPHLARRSARPIALAMAVLLVVAVTWVAAALGGQPATAAAPEAAVAAEGSAAPITAPGGSLPVPDATLDQIGRGIDAWTINVEADQTDFVSATNLASLYFTRGRLTGVLDDYTRASAAIERAIAAYPQAPGARNLEALLALTTHDFAGALSIATDIYAADPSELQALATMGDAQLELGDYVAATATYDRLAAAQAGPAITARQAHLAAVQGRPDDARRLAADAYDDALAAGSEGTSLAWYAFLQGTLAFQDGGLDVSETAFRAALDAWPRSYPALAGLARTRAAQGATDEAIDLYRRAAAIVPQPVTIAALGDLYTLTGRPDEARQAYDEVRVIATLAAANRQVYDRALALFDANHGTDVDEAVSLAAAELDVRKDVYGWDAYAWALHAAGRDAEADDAMQHALALGTRDALLSYHGGMIASALGDTARARELLTDALTINPGFDPLQAQRARATLDALS